MSCMYLRHTEVNRSAFLNVVFVVGICNTPLFLFHCWPWLGYVDVRLDPSSISLTAHTTLTIFFGQSQSGHLISTHLTGDVFIMCFIPTMNYTMKISLQQPESFVIRVGLLLWSYTTVDVLTVLQPGAHKTVKKHNNWPIRWYNEALNKDDRYW